MLVESGKLTDTNKRTFNMAGNIHAKVFAPATNTTTPTPTQPIGELPSFKKRRHTTTQLQTTLRNLDKPMTGLVGLVKPDPIPESNEINQLQPWDFDENPEIDLTATDSQYTIQKTLQNVFNKQTIINRIIHNNDSTLSFVGNILQFLLLLHGIKQTDVQPAETSGNTYNTELKRDVQPFDVFFALQKCIQLHSNEITHTTRIHLINTSRSKMTQQQMSSIISDYKQKHPNDHKLLDAILSEAKQLTTELNGKQAVLGHMEIEYNRMVFYDHTMTPKQYKDNLIWTAVQEQNKLFQSLQLTTKALKYNNTIVMIPKSVTRYNQPVLLPTTPSKSLKVITLQHADCQWIPIHHIMGLRNLRELLMEQINWHSKSITQLAHQIDQGRKASSKFNFNTPYDDEAYEQMRMQPVPSNQTVEMYNYNTSGLNWSSPITNQTFNQTNPVILNNSSLANNIWTNIPNNPPPDNNFRMDIEHTNLGKRPPPNDLTAPTPHKMQHTAQIGRTEYHTIRNYLQNLPNEQLNEIYPNTPDNYIRTLPGSINHPLMNTSNIPYNKFGDEAYGLTYFNEAIDRNLAGLATRFAFNTLDQYHGYRNLNHPPLLPTDTEYLRRLQNSVDIKYEPNSEPQNQQRHASIQFNATGSHKFDYRGQVTQTDVLPFTSVIQDLITTLRNQGILNTNEPDPDSLIIQIYCPGDCITFHTDSKLYGPDIYVISFCTRQEFIICEPGAVRPAGINQFQVNTHNPSGTIVHSLQLYPRSCLRLQHNARYYLEHGIPAVSSLRVSFTFRRRLSENHPCIWN